MFVKLNKENLNLKSSLIQNLLFIAELKQWNTEYQ